MSDQTQDHPGASGELPHWWANVPKPLQGGTGQYQPPGYPTTTALGVPTRFVPGPLVSAQLNQALDELQAQISGFVYDAPSDGSTYGRSNAAWVQALPITGGTLTGSLFLKGDPTQANEAATYSWVNAQISRIPAGPQGPQGPPGPQGPAGGGGLTDAPSDGSSYGRLNAAWAKVAPLASPTFTGTVTIPSGASIAGFAPLASPALTGTPTAPTATAGTNTTQLASTAFVGSAVAASPALNNVGRNLLHNALFNVQQRGAGPWTVTGYTADRWQANVSLDTVSLTVATLSDADRAAIGDESARFCMANTFTGNAGAGAYHYLPQAIEDVRRLAGKTVTFSFWAVASAAGIKLGLNGYQNFGTGGSPSAGVGVQATGASVTLATTWARYSVTMSIPTVSGKTIGTNGNDGTQMYFAYSSGATNNQQFGNIGVQSGTVRIWGVQLEIGSVATPLEKPDPQQDLARCQRFFVSFLQVSLIGSYALAGAIFGQEIFWPVPMRAAPTVVTVGSTPANASGLTTDNITPQGCRAYATVTATGGAAVNGWSFTASADL